MEDSEGGTIDIPEEIQRARAAAAQKEMAKARLILRKVLEADPRNAQAWLAMAEAVERPEQALDCLRRVLVLDPGNAAAQARMAELKRQGVPSKGGAAGPAPSVKAGEIPSTGKVEAAPPGPPPRPAAPRLAERLERAERAGRAAPLPGAPAQSRRPASGGKTAAKGKGKLALPGNKLERILIILAALIGVVLICLTLSVVGQRLLAGVAQATPTQEDVRAVLIENVRAANAEDLDRYMATIHSNSPLYSTTRDLLEDAFANYDLGYELTRAEVVEQSDSQATIFFVLTTRKITGPAFRDNRVTGTMFLRKVGGEWKIYDQKISNVEYLD